MGTVLCRTVCNKSLSGLRSLWERRYLYSVVQLNAFNRNVSSSFNPTPLNQSGVGVYLNRHHRRPGSRCCWRLTALLRGIQTSKLSFTGPTLLTTRLPAASTVARQQSSVSKLSHGDPKGCTFWFLP